MYDEYDDTFKEVDQNLIYTPDNIPCGATRDYFEEEFIGCECSDNCRNCPCYAKNERIIYSDGLLIDLAPLTPIYECNRNCKCGVQCSMKLASLGPISGLKISEFNQKGFGLVTSRSITKGAFICEYAGEILDEEEARRRHGTSRMNYIFWICEHFGEKTVKTIIDPTRIGNIGRFINHSCDPNCILIPVRVDNLVPKLGIFAKANINENDEITFDYGSCESGLISDDKITACFCCALNCCKVLPAHRF